MKKPALLRAALRNAVDHLRDNPEQMHVFIDDGSVVSTGVPGLAWEYRYTLNIVITEFSGDQNLIIAPVLAWLAENQPEDLQHPQRREKLFRFEADILGNDRCDLSIELSLTERVTSAPKGNDTVISTQPEPGDPDSSWEAAGWTVHRG